MENIYQFIPTEIFTISNYSGYTNFVNNIKWSYQLITFDDYYFTVTGEFVFDHVDPNNYIEFGNLTNEDIISWFEQLEDVNSLKTVLDNMYNDMLNPQ